MARALKFECEYADNVIMHHQPKQEYKAMTIAITLFLIAFAALSVGCTSSTETVPEEPSSPPPCYEANEPNDSFQTPNVIVPEAPLYLIEGNIHHLDVDCIVVTGENGVPFGEKLVDLSWDYAAGFDMEVSCSWERSDGVVFPLWGAYDEHGVGHLSPPGPLSVPAAARRLRLSIGQRTLNAPPGQTRYTITVETF